MYICICNAVTDKDIRRAARAGATTVSDLQEHLGVASNCGSCMEDAAAILSSEGAQSNAATFPSPRLYHPALA